MAFAICFCCVFEHQHTQDTCGEHLDQWNSSTRKLQSRDTLMHTCDWLGGIPAHARSCRVQERWSACTLICTYPSIASTDKAVPVVTLIIDHIAVTTRTQSALGTAIEILNTSADDFHREFLVTSPIPLFTKNAKPRQCSGVAQTRQQLDRVRPSVQWH